tara:strand:- start:883 stop:999 length:117 start_codon:yes stop_codon:yes gene_type:complete
MFERPFPAEKPHFFAKMPVLEAVLMFVLWQYSTSSGSA